MPKLAQILKQSSGTKKARCVSVFFFSDNFIKQIDFMLPWVCSVTDHRWRQLNVIKTSSTHRLQPVWHFVVFTTFWCHLWFITEQTYSNMESISLAPKAWLNQGLPGCKLGWTNQTFLVFQPGLLDLTICAKSLVNQGIPGKPGYPKNQENQILTRLLKIWMNFTICAKSLVYQGIQYLVSLVSVVILRTRKTRLKPGS